jgi:hypothetical protein
MLANNGIIQTVRDTAELVADGMLATSSACSRLYNNGKDSNTSSVRKYRLTTAKPSAMRRGVISVIILCLRDFFRENFGSSPLFYA